MNPLTTAQTFYLNLFSDLLPTKLDYKAQHALRGTPKRPQFARATRKPRLFKGWRP